MVEKKNGRKYQTKGGHSMASAVSFIERTCPFQHASTQPAHRDFRCRSTLNRSRSKLDRIASGEFNERRKARTKCGGRRPGTRATGCVVPRQAWYARTRLRKLPRATSVITLRHRWKRGERSQQPQQMLLLLLLLPPPVQQHKDTQLTQAPFGPHGSCRGHESREPPPPHPPLYRYAPGPRRHRWTPATTSPAAPAPRTSESGNSAARWAAKRTELPLFVRILLASVRLLALPLAGWTSEFQPQLEPGSGGPLVLLWQKIQS
uniref:Uncharacterized protein n=1 Tax=Anopheles farauti TaxID=69004 RepID=A0A182QEY0_9DIPT